MEKLVVCNPGAIVMVIGFGAFFVKKRKEENENQKST